MPLRCALGPARPHGGHAETAPGPFMACSRPGRDWSPAEPAHDEPSRFVDGANNGFIDRKWISLLDGGERIARRCDADWSSSKITAATAVRRLPSACPVE